MRAAVGEPAAQPPYLGYSWQCSRLTPGANPNPTRLGRVAPGSAEACLSCVQVGGRADQAGRGYAKEPHQLVRLQRPSRKLARSRRGVAVVLQERTLLQNGVMCLVAGCIMCGHNIMTRCHIVHLEVYMSH